MAKGRKRTFLRCPVERAFRCSVSMVGAVRDVILTPHAL